MTTSYEAKYASLAQFSIDSREEYLPQVPTAKAVVVASQEVHSTSHVSNRRILQLSTKKGESNISVLETPAEIPDYIPAYLKPQGPIVAPDYIKVEHHKHELLLKKKWKGSSSSGDTGLVCITIAWNGFLIFFIVSSILQGDYAPLVLTLLHDAVGVYLIYVCAQNYLNTTYVRVTRDDVLITHLPLSRFTKASKTSLMYVTEICCKREVTQKTGKGRNKSNPYTITFEVHAVVENTGEHRKILTDVPNVDEALFIVQEMEKFLGLSLAVDNEAYIVEGHLI